MGRLLQRLNAAYAADGYARTHGLSALITTYGVGELSALCGIAGAFAEHLPIIATTGAPPMSEITRNPEQARKHFHFDPITIAVQDKAALEHWESYLDEKKLPHSPILVAIQAWLIVVEDPDGNRIRLYTLETHSRDLKPDEGDRWLND